VLLRRGRSCCRGLGCREGPRRARRQGRPCRRRDRPQSHGPRSRGAAAQEGRRVRSVLEEQAALPRLPESAHRRLANGNRRDRRSMPAPRPRPVRFKQSLWCGLLSPETPDSPGQIQLGVIPSPMCPSVPCRRAVEDSGWSCPTVGAVRANGDWDEYWRHHLAAERERVHASRYAGGVILAAA